MTITLTLAREDIKALALEVAKELRGLTAADENETISMEDAAKILGVQCATKKSLSSAFSRFSNRGYYNPPLISTRVGRERVYRRQDVIDFRNSKAKRNRS